MLVPFLKIQNFKVMMIFKILVLARKINLIKILLRNFKMRQLKKKEKMGFGNNLIFKNGTTEIKIPKEIIKRTKEIFPSTF